MSEVLAPGSVLGMLGGGQLGRMSILAGRALGYRFAVLEPKEGSSAGMVADLQITTAYDSEEGLGALAKAVDRATLEFENIPGRALDLLAGAGVEVFPGKQALETCQNRAREKCFLRDAGIPCAPFELVEEREALSQAVARIGVPCVAKTADFGYDGKGQVKLESEQDLLDGSPQSTQLDELFAGGGAVVLEKWVQFDGEYSILCGRGMDGSMKTYPLIHNTHRNHILHTSVSPVGLSPLLGEKAASIAMGIAEGLDLTGLVAVELFLCGEEWLVNELAPRPHNSGHLTIDAHETSQFEQHIRLVSGLPAGSTRQHTPACMLNLVGEFTQRARRMDPAAFWSQLTGAGKLHLYDKGTARQGRKMGHVTLLGASAADCLQRAEALDRWLWET
jgi:5-(carboxyamino)imidazole ribonucleotide synthase